VAQNSDAAFGKRFPLCRILLPGPHREKHDRARPKCNR
jgi:hypothetical protein